MNLTEWIIKEDLSIKEFTEVFTDVVIENFGTHNYKCVIDIVNNKLSEQQTTTEAKETTESEALHIGSVTNRTFECAKCGGKYELLAGYLPEYCSAEIEGKENETCGGELIETNM